MIEWTFSTYKLYSVTTCMYNTNKLLRETCCRLVTCLDSSWLILSLQYISTSCILLKATSHKHVCNITLWMKQLYYQQNLWEFWKKDINVSQKTACGRCFYMYQKIEQKKRSCGLSEPIVIWAATFHEQLSQEHMYYLVDKNI